MRRFVNVLRAGRVWFSAVQLAVLFALWLIAIGPGFRGGGFVRAVLSLLVVLQVWALYVDLGRAAARAQLEDAAPARPVAAAEAEAEIDGVRFAVVLGYFGLLFGLVYLAGMYVGFFVFLLAYWWGRQRRGLLASVALAGLFGLAVPYLFSAAVRVPLWTGAIPELVPGLVGGSITPPF